MLEHGFWSLTAWVQMLALPLTGCVILGKLINVSVSLFSHPLNEDCNNTYLRRLL